MNGFISLIKPVGISSAQAVSKVKHLLKLPKNVKIGHMGTLDPQASGVLLIALGNATRSFNLLLNKHKTYIAEFTFGYETDTLDSEGSIIAESQKIPSLEEISAVLPQFLGKIKQLPPMYSAKNVNGARAYDLARQGKVVTLRACDVEIYKYTLLKSKGEATFEFEIECSSGTYIRSLCRDLANALDTKATMTALCRTKFGVFDIENSTTFETLTEADIIPIPQAFLELNRLDLTDEEFRYFSNGRKLALNQPLGLYLTYFGGDFLGICEVNQEHNLKRRV